MKKLKLPWMQYYATDWLSDPLVSKCEPATRGILHDWICNMHLLDRCGQITGTREQLARAGRCTVIQVDAALTDLRRTKAADVTIRNENVTPMYELVTVINRRMKREAKEREAMRLRVEKHRKKEDGNADVRLTRARARLTLKESESESESYTNHKASGTAKAPPSLKFSPRQADLTDRFDTALGIEWENDRQKWMGRIKHHTNKTERVLAEVENAIKESRIKTTPARYAENIWEEFK